jgi:hypothetical protein
MEQLVAEVRRLRAGIADLAQAMENDPDSQSWSDDLRALLASPENDEGRRR